MPKVVPQIEITFEIDAGESFLNFRQGIMFLTYLLDGIVIENPHSTHNHNLDIPFYTIHTNLLLRDVSCRARNVEDRGQKAGVRKMKVWAKERPKKVTFVQRK